VRVSLVRFGSQRRVVGVVIVMCSSGDVTVFCWQNRERKCADTIGTVLVPWAGHFQC